MSEQVTPEVVWAQRSSKDDAEKNFIYLTISVPDVTDKTMKLNVTPTKLTFTGTSETKKTTYHVELEFYAEIDPENSKTNKSAKDIEFKLRKKELNEEYWPRLVKTDKKLHFLRTDFDKWIDQDEQNEVPEDDYMNNFGGAGLGEDGGFGGIDFSKLGKGAGADEGEEGEEEEEDDEDMPDLEAEDDEDEDEEEAEEEVKGKGKAPAGKKVEEVV